MNSRFKELADKVWSLDTEPNPHFEICLQAFAELIVQECIDKPPQREWVGLTNEEIIEIDNSIDSRSYSLFTYTRAIEAKLKEKNDVLRSM